MTTQQIETKFAGAIRHTEGTMNQHTLLATRDQKLAEAVAMKLAGYSGRAIRPIHNAQRNWFEIETQTTSLLPGELNALKRLAKAVKEVCVLRREYTRTVTRYAIGSKMQPDKNNGIAFTFGTTPSLQECLNQPGSKGDVIYRLGQASSKATVYEPLYYWSNADGIWQWLTGNQADMADVQTKLESRNARAERQSNALATAVRSLPVTRRPATIKSATTAPVSPQKNGAPPQRRRARRVQFVPNTFTQRDVDNGIEAGGDDQDWMKK